MDKKLTNHSRQADELNLDEVTIKLGEWFRYLWSKAFIIFIVGMTGGALGLLYSIYNEPVYTAQTTFVLEEGDKGGLGQYAGIASMVGIDIGGMGGNGLFQGDNIIQLYRSRKMIQETLLSPAVFDGKKMLLIDRFLLKNEIVGKWKRVTEKDIHFNPKHLTLIQDSILRQVVKGINKNSLNISKADKKLDIFTVSFYSEDEYFAKTFVDMIVEKVNTFYKTTKTSRSSSNVAVLQRRTDSVKAVLYNSLKSTATAVDDNPNANQALQRLRVPTQRRQVDVQVSSALYAELVKNLELSKLSLSRETPLIQIIDSPILPLENDKLGKTLSILIGGILAGIFAVVYFIASAAIRKLKFSKSDAPENL